MPTNLGGAQLGQFQLAGDTGPNVFDRDVTSTLTLTQQIATLHEAVTSTLNLSQAIVETEVYSRSVSSTLTLTQEIQLVREFGVVSTLTLSQNIVEEHSKPRALSDSLGETQTISRQYIGSRLVVQGLNWTHARDLDAVFLRSVENTFSPTQSIVAQHCKKVDSTLTLSQTISLDKLKHVHHSLDLGQEVTYTCDFVRPIVNLTGINQTVARTMIHNEQVFQGAHFPGTLFHQTIVQARVKGVTQSIGLSQSIVAFRASNVHNTYSPTHSYSINQVANKDVEHSLNLSDEIVMTRTHRWTTHHGLGFDSYVRKSKVSNQSVNQSIGLNQTIRFNVYSRTVAQSLSLSQGLVYTPVYPRSVGSLINLGQTIGVNTVKSLSVSSTLVFPTYRSIYVGMNGLDYYNVDNVQYSLVKRNKKSLCVLQTNNAAITLPAPEFGDGETYEGVFTIRRSMNNIPYTHIRSLSLRKLNLPWVISKRKAWELREFLIQHNADPMTLTTWKGDKWFVNLLTNPLELRVSGKYSNEDEKVSVELEFEGLKVM